VDNPEVERVWLEVECLDKALTFRAQLRTVAARILQQMVVTQLIYPMQIALTDRRQAPPGRFGVGNIYLRTNWQPTPSTVEYTPDDTGAYSEYFEHPRAAA
jgi:hypothetical protein